VGQHVANTRKLLMIAYHFPPFQGSSGIQRTLKFATYLHEHGWEPLVLTITPKAYESTSANQLREIPENLVVERALGLDSARHLAIRGRYFRWMAQPDRWLSWWPGAVWSGMRMIRRHKPAAIFSTSPIATAHMIGLSLCKRSGLPWVADFRDSMTEPGYPRNPKTWEIHRKLEHETVHHCTRAVFTTEPTRQMYSQRYKDIAPSRWAVIENGFDEENFRDAELDLPAVPLSRPGQITLLHSGILYPIERNPRPFFDALAMLKHSGSINGSRLQIILRATGNDDFYRPLIAELGIGDIVRLAATLSYRDALQEMLRVDGLLLFQAASCNHQIPAKIYEYYRSGRPILGLVDPDGISAKMLSDAKARHIADIASAEDIAKTIPRFLESLSAGLEPGISKQFAMKHSRKSRTKELALLLDELAKS
jgi:glycosyltransferase involved in cell wall biosynthesis